MAKMEDPMTHIRTVDDTPARLSPKRILRPGRRVGIAAIIALLLSGCLVEDESAGEKMPEPSVRRVDPPVYNAEESERAAEVEQYLVEQYRDYSILYTTQTHLGDIIDWLDPATVPGSQVDPPPPIPPSEYMSPNAELQVTELDQFPELRAPEGIPVTRPTFEPYIRGWVEAASVEDFLNQQEGGRPAGETRLYAGLTSLVDNWGGAGKVNPFAGTVEKGTFSLMELAVSCDGADKDKTLELVGIVASQDKRHFDGLVRLQVEFLAEGLTYGHEKGGWHGIRRGFVPFEGALYGPGLALVPLSAPGGTQYASYFKILRAPNGDWWLAHNGNWLGYYPAKFFDLINTKACDVSWYGEVFDKTPTDWTETDMGSGEFAAKGFGYASYVENMTYYDTSGAANAPSTFGTMGPTDPACYTKSDVLLDSLGVPYFLCGGPGGDATGCD
jgi:hypothetical protein